MLLRYFFILINFKLKTKTYYYYLYVISIAREEMNNWIRQFHLIFFLNKNVILYVNVSVRQLDTNNSLK